MITDQELIEIALKIAIPVELSDLAEAASVASALITDKGNIYTGVCIDTKCSMGFCAEHNAIGSMITNGEKNIQTIVAVNYEGKIYSPCGRCREFIYQVSDYNINTRVIIDSNNSKTINELLPDHWKDQS